MSKFHTVIIFEADENMVDHQKEVILVTNSKEEEENYQLEMSGEATVTDEFIVLGEDVVAGFQIIREIEHSHPRNIVHKIPNWKHTDDEKDDEVFKYKDLNFGNKVHLLARLDFELCYDTSTKELYLKDLQGGNMANIENDRFKSIDDVMSRLENYWKDMRIFFI